MARLLRGDGVSGHGGDLLALVNCGASVVIGLGVGLASHSVCVGFAAVAIIFGGLFALLAHRGGQKVAAAVAVLGVAFGAGAIGWFFAGAIGAVVPALGAGVIAAACYVSIIRSLARLPADWY